MGQRQGSHSSSAGIAARKPQPQRGTSGKEAAAAARGPKFVLRFTFVSFLGSGFSTAAPRFPGFVCSGWSRHWRPSAHSCGMSGNPPFITLADFFDKLWRGFHFFPAVCVCVWALSVIGPCPGFIVSVFIMGLRFTLGPRPLELTSCRRRGRGACASLASRCGFP